MEQEESRTVRMEPISGSCIQLPEKVHSLVRTVQNKGDAMFEAMDRAQQMTIYLGLKSLLETSRYSYAIYHNGDPGHPVYRDGIEGINTGPRNYIPDSAEKNTVYKMLAELSEIFRTRGDTEWEEWYDFSEWSNFCKYVLTEYERRNEDAS